MNYSILKTILPGKNRKNNLSVIIKNEQEEISVITRTLSCEKLDETFQVTQHLMETIETFT
jgi:hypothetical protein